MAIKFLLNSINARTNLKISLSLNYIYARTIYLRKFPHKFIDKTLNGYVFIITYHLPTSWRLHTAWAKNKSYTNILLDHLYLCFSSALALLKSILSNTPHLFPSSFSLFFDLYNDHYSMYGGCITFFPSLWNRVTLALVIYTLHLIF